MAIISFTNVTKYYVNDLILDHVSFSINKGEKVALIGNNGVGKTTIFKLILKEEEPTLVSKEDKPGDISILNGSTIGYLDQNAIRNVNNTVLTELLEPFKETIEIEKKIASVSEKIKHEPNNIDLLDKYDSLLKQYEDNRGYTYLNEIDDMIFRFGFNNETKSRVIKELSGGERMKVAFIKILLFKYNVLLLDEPTNHLDISTIEWLENFLKTYKGTIFFISHDRYFLETLSDKIVELENHQCTEYNMDYDHYLIEKERNYNSLLKLSSKEDKEIERLRRFIEYYKPKPRFTSRAKDKEHKLARIEANKTTPPIKENKNIKLKIEGGNLANKQLLSFKDVVIGYDKPLCPEFSFDVYGQDRIAVCGDNGIGKTTFLKSIIKEIPLINGKIRELRPINYGYIKQNDYIFKSGENALTYLRNKYPIKLDRELRTILGSFQFKGEDVFKDTSLMSNGEKMRLILCSFSLSGYEVLLLDEPTNHLDMVTKECLIKALDSYKGAIIFISHDRYFINQLADYTLYLSRDYSMFIEGDYNRLHILLEKRNKELKLIKIEDIEHPKIVRPEKLSNNKVQEYTKEMSDIEKRVAEIEEALEDDFESYEEIDKLQEEKDILEHRYMEVMDILEKDKNNIEIE